MRDFAKLHTDMWVVRLIGHAGLAMLFAAILAFLAPRGTFLFNGIERLGYWTFQMAAWLTLSALAYVIVWSWPVLRRQSRSVRRLAATFIASIPMLVVVGVANNMMNGWLPEGVRDIAGVYLTIALIGGAYAYLSAQLLDYLLMGHAPKLTAARGDTPIDAEPIEIVDQPVEIAGPTPSDPTLLDRLPPHIRGDILCLQVEDHYVRVHSKHGNAMVLMRFTDALRCIDHIPGAQVHRSWWVSIDAVTGLQRTGRTAQLTLSNEMSVPVSQPYLVQAVDTWGALETKRFA